MTGIVLIVFAVWGMANLVAGGLAWLGFRIWCRSVDWTADGVMPSALEYAYGDGRDVVVFVHGFNDVPFVWRRMAEVMASRGFTADVIRLPGAGARRPNTSLAALRRAVADRVERWTSLGRRVFLVGHSMGGALVLDFLCRGRKDRAKVAGACLLAPLVEISRARSPLLTPQAWYRVLRILLPAVRCLPSVFRREPCADDDPAFRYRRDGWNALCLYEALFQLICRIRTLDRKAIEAPFLVVTAGDDRVVDSRAAEAWFKACPACREVVTVPGARHELQMQACWRDLVDRLASFLEREGEKS